MSISDIYRGITTVMVGNGSSALFWKDVWLEQPLELSHPRAFSFTKLEDASIADFLSITTLPEGFHLPLTAHARLEVHDMQVLTTPTTLGPTNDEWTCMWGTAYSSRKFYAHYFRDVEADEAFRWIWKSRCTMKIKVFTWLLAADRINTRNMLHRRHYNVGNNVNCTLCGGGAEETVEHLFFECPFSANCWSSIGLTWRVDGHRLKAIHSGRLN